MTSMVADQAYRRIMDRPALLDDVEAIAAELEAADLITIQTAHDGSHSYMLTPKGAQVGRSMALGRDADAVLEALLQS
jgi:hypothetical protein